MLQSWPSFGNQAPSQIRLIREQIGGEDHVDMEQLRLAFDVHCKDLINTAQDWVKRTPRSESIYGILSVLIKLGFAGPYPEGLDSLTEDLILRQLINDSLLPHH